MEYLLKASAVIIIFYLCYKLFLQRETFFQSNRWFLLAGLITALVFPFIVIPIYITIEPITLPETAFYIDEITGLNTMQPETNIKWRSLILIIYVIGLTLFLIQFLLQFGSLVLLLLKNPKRKDGLYTYIIVKSKVSPFSFFKWIIYNPKQFDDKELQLILNHEKVHAQQFHSIDVLATHLACILFWFNPLVWLYKKDLQQNLEYIADSKAQNEAKNIKDYQHLLLKTSISNQVGITNNFYNSLIKKRIVMLNTSKSKAIRQWKIALILPLLAIFLMSFSTKEIFIETEEASFITSTDKAPYPFNVLVDEVSYPNYKIVNKKKGNPLIVLNNKIIAENALSKIKFKDVFSTQIMHSEQAVLKYGEKAKGGAFIIYTLKNKFFNVSENNHVEIIFNKDMSDSHMKKIEEELKVDGIAMTINTIERNQKGEITSINVRFKTENGSANYNNNDENGIKPFYFRIDEDGAFGVGRVHEHKDNTHTEVRHSSSTDHVYPNNQRIDTVDIHNIKIDTVHAKHIVTNSFWINSNDKSDINVLANGNNFAIRNNGDIPLYIVDGEEVLPAKINLIDVNTIESVNVLKDESSIKLYGKKGGNGVIIIKTKGDISKTNKDKWTFAVGVEKTENTNSKAITAIGYANNKNTYKNSTLAYISMHSSDKVLKENKSSLEKLGIKTKYSKLKRNKSGKIIRLKIILKDTNGNETSTVFKNDDGIPGISYGKFEDKLLIASN